MQGVPLTLPLPGEPTPPLSGSLQIIVPVMLVIQFVLVGRGSVSQFVRLREVREVASSKIPFMFVTREVLKFERSRVMREEAPLNMAGIESRLDVSKLERLREVREDAPLNIAVIFDTFVVSKLERLSDVREEAP